MSISVDFISGIMVGLEFVEDMGYQYIVLDLFILRILFERVVDES